MPTPTITGYELLGKLSDGATPGSTLYKGWQTNLKRYVALRILDEDEADDLDYLRRFRNEAHAAMDIRQRNVVSTLDQGMCSNSGLHYVAYEYVKGPSLQKILHNVSNLSEEEAVALIHGVSLGLCCLERAKLVHGEVSPAKVLLNEEGVPMLAEVGLARRLEGLGSPSIERGPEFVSPEQALGLSSLDTRTDLFALGVTLFRLLTGVYPFQGEEAFEIVTQTINAEIPDPRDLKPSLSAGLSKVLSGLTARDPDERYPTAEAASFDLARLRANLDVLGPSGAESAIASGQSSPNLSESKVLKVLLSESAAHRQLKTSNPTPAPPSGSASDRPQPFKVRVFTGDVQLSERRFDQDVVVIGRAVGCDVQIDNPIVSRKHVEIRRRGGTFALVAHRTTNGTTVNSTPVKDAHALRLDERIVVSDKFRLEIEVERSQSDDMSTVSATESDEPDLLQSLSKEVEREREATDRTRAELNGKAEDPAPTAGDPGPSEDDTPVEGTPVQEPARQEPDGFDRLLELPDDPPTEQQIRRSPSKPGAKDGSDPKTAKHEPAPAAPITEFEVPAFGRRGTARSAREPRKSGRVEAVSKAAKPVAASPRAYLTGQVDGVQIRTAVDRILQIGKAEGCTFRLPGTFAPRKAALVVPFGGAFHLVNVAPASDAVLRNGAPVDDMVVLQSGDQIAIGALKLTLELS